MIAFPRNHKLEIDGTLLIEGGIPVFLPNPEGYSISMKYTIPMQSEFQGLEIINRKF